MLGCVVAFLSFLAAELGGMLVVRPEMLWPIWPGCAFLVSVLLLAPRKIWPIVLAAGLAGFAVYDVHAGLQLRPMGLLIVSDTVEVLIAALGLSYSFRGPVRLDNVKSLIKYSFFAVFLGPMAAAFIATAAFGQDYWIRWRIGFFTEALALLTLTPAILTWAGTKAAWIKKPRAFYLEATALVAGLSFLSYAALVAPGRGGSPVLLYSLLPFLLWSALRFGVSGIGTAMTVVAVLSTWGAIHGRGPFTAAEPLRDVMSLQLFLFLAAATFMVLAVVVEERKQTERSFRESERRFRLVADTAPVLIWMSDTDKLCTYFNQPWLDFTGRPIEAELGNGWVEGVHQEDLLNCQDTYARSFDRRESFEMQYRLRRHDGEYRWVLDVGVPRFDLDGSFLGYIGSCLDVTTRKVAEEALAGVRRKLIEAHEEERSWIARELHDDINQRIALLAVELDRFEQHRPSSRKSLDYLRQVRQGLFDLGKDIQALSHRLHSSKLDYLGIVVAARSFCREFAEQKNVEINFTHQDMPRSLPKEISLCVFRVLQESLQNAAKHSGVRFFKVDLNGTTDTVQLTVSDLGVGFDADDAINNRGLGLISMRERLQLVSGEISIESQPGGGTTIRARVPFSSSGDSQSMAG
jgi:PAS domain S-box-containing protein